MKRGALHRTGIRKILTQLHRSPEDRILILARKGVLKKIAEEAIHRSQALGLSVTIVEKGVLYRIAPQGKREKIKAMEPARMKYQKEQVFSVKAAS